MRGKTGSDIAALMRGVPDGATLAVGGFGTCGTPIELIDALIAAGARDLHVVSNNCGTDEHGLGLLLRAGRIRRITASYVGDNGTLATMYANGDVELELCPQGTLAEKMRAGGAGIPAFYTATGVGTMIADGGLPIRYGPSGSVALASDPKPTADFDGKRYVLERAVVADYALIHAQVADRAGNLRFRRAARNFNPLAATCGRVTIVEAETIVDDFLAPDEIHLPGIFVQHVVPSRATTKRVDRLTLRGEAERWGVML